MRDLTLRGGYGDGMIGWQALRTTSDVMSTGYYIPVLVMNESNSTPEIIIHYMLSELKLKILKDYGLK